MAEYAKLPKVGLTMKTGIVSTFLVAKGDSVKKGDVIAEFETDKITGQIESPIDGTVLEILVGEGDEVEVLAPIMTIGAAGDVPAPSSTPNVVDVVTSATPAKKMKAELAISAQAGWILATPKARHLARENGIELGDVTGSSADGIIRAKDVVSAIENGKTRTTHLAQKIATESGVDLKNVTGSGPHGRIGKDDVWAATQTARTRDDFASGESRQKMSGMRRMIAERLTMSKQTIPHVYFKSEVDATSLIAFKNTLKLAHDSGTAPKVSVNDILLKAVATALSTMPQMRAQLDGDEIVTSNDVNLGVAVSVENGLLVPVIRAADKLTLSALAQQSAALSQKAREGRLMPEEFKGGNFTVTNLGASGIDEFCAIINPPEAGILAVGAAKEKPVVRNGEVVIRTMMMLTLSVDHRLIDGATAAEFMKRLKDTVENVYLAII